MQRLALPHRLETLGLCHNFPIVCWYTYFVQVTCTQVTLHKKAVSLSFASLDESHFTERRKRQVFWQEIKSIAGCAYSHHFWVSCQISRKGQSLQLEVARCGMVYEVYHLLTGLLWSSRALGKKKNYNWGCIDDYFLGKLQPWLVLRWSCVVDRTLKSSYWVTNLIWQQKLQIPLQWHYAAITSLLQQVSI